MLDWIFRQQDYVQHAIFGLLIQLTYMLVAAPLMLWTGVWLYPDVVGAIAVSHQFYGREERDHENKVSSSTDDWADWLPWHWGEDERTDFAAAFVVVWLLSALVELTRVMWFQ